MKLTIVEAVRSDIFMNSTGVSDYDSLLDPREKEYYRTKKNRIGYIEYMTPDEYIEQCAEYGFKDPTTYERLVSGRRNDKGSMEWLRNYLEQGNQFYMPYLNKADRRQEGLHRSLIAKDLGIEKIPVLVIDVADQEVERQMKKDEHDKDVFRAVDREIQGIEHLKFETSDDLMDELEWELDIIKRDYEYPYKINVDTVVNDIVQLIVDDTKINVVFDTDDDGSVRVVDYYLEG